MTIYHKHHIIPKHMGGTDEPSNLIEVTVEQHALLHKQLWDDLGHWQDYAAWQGLTKTVGQEELIRLIQSKTHKGKIVSDESRRKMSIAHTGEKQTHERIEKRRLKLIGQRRTGSMSIESRQKMSIAKLGKVAHNKGISGPLLGIKKDNVTCPHCKKIGGKPTMMKWHFVNCKMKI